MTALRIFFVNFNLFGLGRIDLLRCCCCYCCCCKLLPAQKQELCCEYVRHTAAQIVFNYPWQIDTGGAGEVEGFSE